MTMAQTAHPKRRSKVVALPELAALVPDGCRLAIGGFPLYQVPMAFVRELIRADRKHLTIVGGVNGLEIDLLAAHGSIDVIETSYVGLEQFGLAPNFRAAVESGKICVHELSEELAFDRFRASQENLPFWPCSYLAGTSIPIDNPLMVAAICPLTGRDYFAVSPAAPDVVVLHMAAADEYGNVLTTRRQMLPQSIDLLMARGCDRVLVTVERLVSNEFVRANPELTQIPGFQVTAVAEAPWGAHPTSMLGFYDIDEAHMASYVSSGTAGITEYVNHYVHQASDHRDYLNRVGLDSLVSIGRWAAL